MEDEPEEIYEEEVPAQEAPMEEEEELLVSPAAVPVTLKVELGKIEMGADKLLTLSPGNLLELHTHPDSPVHLVINGRTVGKGELMMMGEALGVRIIELGK